MNAATESPSWSAQRTCLVTDYCEGYYSTRPLSKHAVNAPRGDCSSREIALHDASVRSIRRGEMPFHKVHLEYHDSAQL